MKRVLVILACLGLARFVWAEVVGYR